MQVLAQLAVGFVLTASAVKFLRKAKPDRPPAVIRAPDTFPSATTQTGPAQTSVASAEHVDIDPADIGTGLARRHLITSPGSPAGGDRTQAMMGAMTGAGLCTRVT